MTSDFNEIKRRSWIPKIDVIRGLGLLAAAAILFLNVRGLSSGQSLPYVPGFGRLSPAPGESEYYLAIREFGFPVPILRQCLISNQGAYGNDDLSGMKVAIQDWNAWGVAINGTILVSLPFLMCFAIRNVSRQKFRVSLLVFLLGASIIGASAGLAWRQHRKFTEQQALSAENEAEFKANVGTKMFLSAPFGGLLPEWSRDWPWVNRFAPKWLVSEFSTLQVDAKSEGDRDRLLVRAVSLDTVTDLRLQTVGVPTFPAALSDRLEQLEVSGCYYPGDGMDTLIKPAQLGVLPNLQRLALHACILKPATDRHSTQFANVSFLLINECLAEPPGLGDWIRLPRLRHLTIYIQELFPADFEALGQATGLEQITLFITNINDSGIAIIARLPNLKWLHLIGSPYLSDTAIAHLATSKSLTFLDVSACDGISLSGLLALKACPTLEYLIVSNSEESFIQTLRAELPHVKVLCAGTVDYVLEFKLRGHPYPEHWDD